MTEQNGWVRTILDVNLKTGKITKEPVSRDMTKKYLGGRCIAARMLYDQVGPETDPFGEDNIIIVTVGVLGGTTAPSSGRCDLTTKSPYTGIYVASNLGGFFGPELRWAGYDFIIIRGKSEKPVYLWIDNDDVSIRDAGYIWGKDTWATQQMIRDKLGDPEIKTLKIGPAGENLCFSSCVVGDLSRAAGRMSIGAVWGSKKLKAIAVRGSKGINIHKPDQFERKCRELVERAKKDPLYQRQSAYGTIGWVWDPYLKTAMPGQFPHSTAEEIFNTNLFDKSLACFDCDLHCSHYYTVKEGKYAGTRGEGFEAMSALSGARYTGIDDPAFLCKYNSLCNKLGLDIVAPGPAIGWAMNLYRDGVITKDDTGGIEITLGNEEAVLELVHMIARNEGFGRVLDGYPRRSVEMLGKGELYAADQKRVALLGSGIALSSLWTFGQAVSTRGRDHLIGAPWVPTSHFMPEITDEILEKLGRERYSDKNVFLDNWEVSPNRARVVFDHENIFAICDMTGICKFRSEMGLYVEGVHIEDFADLLSTATDMDFTPQDLIMAAERQLCIQRAFNAREGIRRKDDYPFAFRWQLEHKERHPRYNYKELPINMEKCDRFLDEYYKLRGCDLKTGIPTRKKLEEHNLEDIADDLEKRGMLSRTI